ncbi:MULTISPECIES: glycosyltransferase [unclassified Knoellia]|uniref:glycosyltransferase n=1 Tax=Knoellia altitudinis TaxID=3404795 RepID=UPI003608E85B
MIRAVHVVIPARDEEQLLPRCLASLERARLALRVARPDLLVDTSVVLDRCGDRSGVVVDAARVHSRTVDFGMVGATRDAGVRWALSSGTLNGIRPDELWIACTDADTVVPEHWLTGQLDLALAHDAVIGTVEPYGLTDTEVLALWRARHHLFDGHPHVHGANLGLRGSTYLEVGGFRALATDEDVDLVRRIRAHTDRWVATDAVRVASSARRIGRARGGFADFIVALEEEVG